MKLWNSGKKPDQVDGTISKNFIRYVFPHRGKLELFVCGMNQWGFTTPQDFKVSELGVGIDICSDIMDRDLKKCINFYKGVSLSNIKRDKGC